jgi:hypothetical protein
MNAQQLKLSVLFGSILLAACGTVVNGGGGSGDPNQNSSTGETPDDTVRPAVAYTRAQNDVLWDEYWASQGSSGGSTSGSSGGNNLDPNDLFLRLSDLGVACTSPTTELSCGGHYEMTLVLPQALQAVGVYDLEDPQLIAYSSMSESGDLNSSDPNDCPWGGGSVGSGSLEIISINDAEVRFKVSLAGSLWSSDPSGEYTAPRCATP